MKQDEQAVSNHVVVPDVAGVIEGWRGWGFGQEARWDGLYSASHTIRWPAGEEMRATCIYHDKYIRFHKEELLPPNVAIDPNLAEHIQQGTGIPFEGCTCGIYAVEEGGNFRNIPGCTVVGKVAMWGKVVRGTRATRAEFAYPIVLYAPDDWVLEGGDKLELLASYGVPVLPRSELPERISQRFLNERRPRRKVDIVAALAISMITLAVATLNFYFGMSRITSGHPLGWLNVVFVALILFVWSFTREPL